MHYAKLAALAAAVLSLAGAMPAAAQSQDANKVTDLGVYPPWQGGETMMPPCAASSSL